MRRGMDWDMNWNRKGRGQWFEEDWEGERSEHRAGPTCVDNWVIRGHEWEANRWQRHTLMRTKFATCDDDWFESICERRDSLDSDEPSWNFSSYKKKCENNIERWSAMAGCNRRRKERSTKQRWDGSRTQSKRLSEIDCFGWTTTIKICTGKQQQWTLGRETRDRVGQHVFSFLLAQIRRQIRKALSGVRQRGFGWELVT